MTYPEVKPMAHYGVVETARLLGVHRSTVSRWVRDGQLKSRINRRTLRTVIFGRDIMSFYNAL